MFRVFTRRRGTRYLHFAPNPGNVLDSAQALVVKGVLVLFQLRRRLTEYLHQLRVESVQELIQALHAA